MPITNIENQCRVCKEFWGNVDLHDGNAYRKRICISCLLKEYHKLKSLVIKLKSDAKKTKHRKK